MGNDLHKLWNNYSMEYYAAIKKEASVGGPKWNDL